MSAHSLFDENTDAVRGQKVQTVGYVTGGGKIDIKNMNQRRDPSGVLGSVQQVFASKNLDLWGLLARQKQLTTRNCARNCLEYYKGYRMIYVYQS